MCVGNGPNTVSESTVSRTELSEFFGPRRVPGRELSELFCQPFVCVPKRTHEFFAELTEFAVQLSEAQGVLFSDSQCSRFRVVHKQYPSVGGPKESTPEFRKPSVVACECGMPCERNFFAYMIYLERPEYPEYAMHIFYLKYSRTQKMGIC